MTDLLDQDWFPEDLFARWLAVRASIGKPATERAVTMAKRQLTTWHLQGHDIRAVIQQSIDKKYTGLFEPRKRKEGDKLSQSFATGKQAGNLSDMSVSLVFVTLDRRYGPKFRATFEDKEARHVWMADMAAEGVTDMDISRGLERTRMMDWPPSVAELTKACLPTPEDLGLPSAASAYSEAMSCFAGGRWTSRHVFHAAIEAGYTRMIGKNGLEIFADKYHAAIRLPLTELRQVPAGALRRLPMNKEEAAALARVYLPVLKGLCARR